MTQDPAALLRQLSPKEKIALCSGGDFWHTKAVPQLGLPPIMLCDGPHGLRKQPGAADMAGVNRSLAATCFPTAVSTACSWDEALLEAVAAAIGREALAEQVGLVLGPGLNIKRSPLCGRNFEYFSEDPLLSGKLAAAFVRGMEGAGSAACLKHFALNSQEFKRYSSDSLADPRTMREIYLTPFEIAVKEGRPQAVMCAYNKVNGVHCSDSVPLLRTILREEWGFDGLVVTDWGAMNDRVAAFQAGCDLNMPGGSAYQERDAEKAIQSGKLNPQDVDASAARVLYFVSCAAKRLSGSHPVSPEAHHTLARRAAAESGVLLKNDGPLLPLSPGGNYVLLGAMAKRPRYQGAGSSHINPTRLVSPVEAMPDLPFVPGCDDLGNTTADLLRAAAEAAARADAAIVFAGLPEAYECEGFDRDTMSMPQGHLRLIETVAAANPNTIVVLCCGSPVETPWADQVRAILYLGLGGEAIGEAAADLLLGRTVPSGKLAESWPLRLEDCPCASCFGQKDAQYREGIYVGYRYYDKARIPVRWPFGFGLSYTAFSLSDLTVSQEAASLTIANIGTVPGAEVVQLYISPPLGGLHRPVRELKGFRKVFLAPGETRRISFPLTRRSFAVWAEGWQIPGGTYTVFAGTSSRDLPLQAELSIAGPPVPAPRWQSGSWYEHPQGTPSQSQWEAMLGRPYHPQPLSRGHFTMDNTPLEMRPYSRLMALLCWGIEAYLTLRTGGVKNRASPNYRMLRACSMDGALRSMQICGGIRGGLFPGLLEMANGRWGRGFRRLFSR